MACVLIGQKGEIVYSPGAVCVLTLIQLPLEGFPGMRSDCCPQDFLCLFRNKEIHLLESRQDLRVGQRNGGKREESGLEDRSMEEKDR